MPAPTKIAHTVPVGFTTSSSALAYPAGIAVGDGVAVWVDYEGAASNTAALPGWTKLASFSGGGMFKDLFWLPSAVGTESGSVGTITITGSTNSVASAILYRSSTGVLVEGVTSSGADTTSGTAYSASTASVTTVANMLIAYCASMNNTTTRSARTLTQAGATLGTLTAYFGAGTNITQEVGDRPVTTGATAAVVNTYTLGTASTGLTAVLLLSEGAAAATPIAGSDTAAVTDTAALSQLYDANDAATVSEAAALEQRYTVTDATALAESAALQQQTVLSDTATVADAAAVQRQSSATDAAAATEGSTQVERRSAVADAAAVTDVAAVTTQTAGTDSSVLTDTAAATAAATTSDTDTLTESATLQVSSTASDSTALTESASVSELAGKAATDTAALTELAALAVSTGVPGADSAALAESATLQFRSALADTAVLLEGAAVAVQVAATDELDLTTELASALAALTAADTTVLTGSSAVEHIGRTSTRPSTGSTARPAGTPITSTRPDQGTTGRL